MTASELTLDLEFAGRERTIAIQQARRTLILSSCGLVSTTVIVPVLLIALNSGPHGLDIESLVLLPIVELAAVLNWWKDLSRWRWLRRSSPAEVLVELQEPDPPLPPRRHSW